VLWAGIGLGFGWLTERAAKQQFRFSKPARAH